MRKQLLTGLALCAALSIGIAALASAASFKVRSGDLIVTLGGNVSPKAMPKKRYVPVSTTIFGRIDTADGSHPPAFREAVVDIDRDAKVNARGYPVCKAAQLEAQNTKGARRACGKASIGTGLAHAEIKFPEQPPIAVTSPITVFNGGVGGGQTKLLIHTFITVPVPAAIVTRVTIAKKGSGLHSIARIPAIAGGAGSAIDFKFEVGKTFTRGGGRVGYFEARCPDGRFKVTSPKILFRNETGDPAFPSQTVLRGSFLVPCTPKG